jgi:hypothetical protein
VISFTRSLSQLAGLRSAVSRRMALVLCSATTLALFAVTAPAGAVIKKVPTGLGSEEVSVGLQPRSITLHGGAGPEAKAFANSTGAPVLPTNKTYAIYWDPTDNYHGDWQGVIDTFFHNLSAGSDSWGSVYAVDTQYTDAANQHADYASSFQGAYTDTDPYPTSGNCTDPHPLLGEIFPEEEPAAIACITNVQIETELKLFIADHKLPTGMGTIFYLLTPPGVTVCLDGGGPGGHCSDFVGTTKEVADYEAAKARYPEQLTEYKKEHEKYIKEELPKYNKEKKKYEAEVEKYNKQKAKDEAEKEPDVEAEPLAPAEPTEPIEPAEPTKPAGYQSYQNSFCSYHSDINPGNPGNGGPGTILYGAIPWTAGGLADDHIGDEVSAYDCQDGGFDPSSKPGEEKEKAKEKTVKEIKEFEEKTGEEKVKQEEAEVLAGPHQQEPNQALPCPDPDGTCDTGLADLIINQIGVEQQNIVTDPLLSSWKDPSGDEATDECRNFFASIVGGSVVANPETYAGTLYNQSLNGGKYYLNDAFNLAALNLSYPGVPCLPGIRLEPKFTAPNLANSGEIVGFDGMESDITLNEGTAYTGTTAKNTYATYTWNFGDGTPEVTGFAPGAPTQNSPETTLCAEPWLAPCAASTFHSYQYGGVYNVTLTVTDTGGNKESVSQEITVVGPPRPEEKGSGGSGSEGGGSGATTGATSPSTVAPTTGTSTATSGGGSSSAKPLPVPVASAAAVSHSLRSVLKKGLVIGYSVNEQVAGQFQVLLASSIAKRIGLHGAPATDMPAGSEPSIVIGKAILVTTRGGRGTLKVQFGKKTAAKLRKLRSVTLTIRLVVRNASSRTPISTTVISTVTLSH